MNMKITITIEMDDELLTKVEEHENETMDEGGINSVSQYGKIFYRSSRYWKDDYKENIEFLKMIEQYANDTLKTRGYLYLNEVYDMLGLSATKAGGVVGWIYDKENPIGDNYVDFGIFSHQNRDFVFGKRNIALLDFNVDGNIGDYI